MDQYVISVEYDTDLALSQYAFSHVKGKKKDLSKSIQIFFFFCFLFSQTFFIPQLNPFIPGNSWDSLFWSVVQKISKTQSWHVCIWVYKIGTLKDVSSYH